jgi:hypothetical protein
MSIVNWLKGMIRRPGVRRRPGGSAAASFRPQLEQLGDRILPSAGLHLALAPPHALSSAVVSETDCLHVKFTVAVDPQTLKGTASGDLVGTVTFESHHLEPISSTVDQLTGKLKIHTAQGDLFLSETGTRNSTTGELNLTATVTGGNGIYKDATGTLSDTRSTFGADELFQGTICLAS